MVLSDDKGAIGRLIKNPKPIIFNKKSADRARSIQEIISYKTNIVCVPDQ